YSQLFLRNPASGQFENFASSSQFGNVPKWTTHIGGRYEHDLNDGKSLVLRLDYSSKSKRYFSTSKLINPFHDDIVQKGYGLLDGRMSITDIPIGGQAGEISLWMKNITDEKYKIQSIDFGSFGFAGAIYGDPRTYRIDLSVKF